MRNWLFHRNDCANRKSQGRGTGHSELKISATFGVLFLPQFQRVDHLFPKPCWGQHLGHILGISKQPQWSVLCPCSGCAQDTCSMGIVQALRSFGDPLEPTAQPKVPQSWAVPEPSKGVIPAFPTDDFGMQGSHLPTVNLSQSECFLVRPRQAIFTI